MTGFGRNVNFLSNLGARACDTIEAKERKVRYWVFSYIMLILGWLLQECTEQLQFFSLKNISSDGEHP